ncbi:MAG: hypothetical protein IPN69_10755 [Acidobacteria bacterium]|nr:hypothetical protein [Acidobacteriota bacterium]
MKRKVLFSALFVVGLAVGTLAQSENIETVLAQRLALEKKTVIENGKRISKTGIALSEICDLSDPVSARVFREYGAMWVSKADVFAAFKQGINGNSIRFLANCVFKNESEVSLYHQNIAAKALTVGGTTIELQAAAMDALVAAQKDAARQGLSITPRGGSIAAKRNFEDTVRLWNSRFLPGLAHWTTTGKISRRDADNARSLAIVPQVAQVLEWERKGYFFSKDLSKSILYSVAAPGASQHVFMLALDVEQFGNPKVRSILARHGWFQTVKSDMPHFTYLGVEEAELPGLGLVPVTVGGQKFWIPKI